MNWIVMCDYFLFLFFCQQKLNIFWLFKHSFLTCTQWDYKLSSKGHVSTKIICSDSVSTGFFSSAGYPTASMTYWVYTFKTMWYIVDNILMCLQLHISEICFYPRTFLDNTSFELETRISIMFTTFPTRIFCQDVSIFVTSCPAVFGRGFATCPCMLAPF